jgi:hypothetical protein
MATEERRYRTGDVVFREGDAPDGVYLVNSGSLECFHTVGGEELIYAVLKPGDLFGEPAVIANAPRVVTVRAIADAVLDFVPREDFLKSFGGESGLALPLLKLMSLRLREASELLSSRPPPRRRTPTTTSEPWIQLRLRAGNRMMGAHIGERPIRIAHFPFVIGSGAEARTRITPGRAALAREAAPLVAAEHAALELRGQRIYVLHRAPATETHVNGEVLSTAGRHEAVLQLGLNVVVLGNEASPWRLFLDFKT